MSKIRLLAAALLGSGLRFQNLSCCESFPFRIRQVCVLSEMLAIGIFQMRPLETLFSGYSPGVQLA